MQRYLNADIGLTEDMEMSDDGLNFKDMVIHGENGRAVAARGIGSSPRMNSAAKAPQHGGDDGPDFLDNLWNIGKIGTHFAAYNVLKMVPRTGNRIVDKLISTRAGAERGMARGLFKGYFPGIAQRWAFAQGSSTVQEYYTVMRRDGVEAPFYMVGKGEGISKEDFDERLKFASKAPNDLLRHNSRRIDEENMLYRYFNQEWSAMDADDRFMHGDLKGIKEFDKFHSELVKFDLYLMQQSGKKVKVGMTEDGCAVYKYTRPSWLTTLAYNEIGNRIYDALDTLYFNPVQALFGSGIAREKIVMDELKEMRDVLRAAYGQRAPLPHYT